jgi:hypothetical protein
MRFPHLFNTLGGITLVAMSFIATRATAQTVISNEALVTTTFVVNKKSATAECSGNLCGAQTSMLAPISVICPAATGQTCTFHISLDAKVSIYTSGGGAGGGPAGFYQFLVDGAAPTIGPTYKGYYLFEKNGYTTGDVPDSVRLSYPASVVATVTNSSSNSHIINVSVGCRALNSPSCGATAHWSTMRVDVFEP